MNYYIPQKGKIQPKPQRRRRRKAIDRSLLSEAEQQEMGLIDDRGECIGRMVNEEKYNELINRVRYMNTYVQKGYKFTGTIPPPKEINYYLD